MTAKRILWETALMDFGSWVIMSIDKIVKEHMDGCKRRSLQRKKVRRKYYNEYFDFNMKDFGDILKNRVKENAPVTMEFIRSNFTASKKNKVKMAFSLALELKILRVRNGVYYKCENIPEKTYEILCTTRMKEIHAKILELRGVDPLYTSWNEVISKA